MTWPTPVERGFHMPAEWAPHARCWMAWASRPEVWGARFDAICRAYGEVARAIRRFEPVTMIVPPGAEARAAKICGEGIDLLSLPIDDSWSRDSGPTFVVDAGGGVAGVSWRFNAWGGKYAPYDDDDRLAGRLLEYLGLPCFEAPLTLEGGAIHCDGAGTLLTTESCLLNPNRNPGLDKAEAERLLRAYLGVEKVIWLPGDPDEHETDGHIDGIACFARPGLAIIEMPSDPGASYAPIMRENRRALELARDAEGRAFDIVEIRDAAGYEDADERFCRSYVNFYLANGGLIMPRYGLPSDDAIAETFRRLFPGHEIAQVPIAEIAVGGGGIHCITQQQPA